MVLTMNEETWLKNNDPRPMLEYCIDKDISDRKLRLWSAACADRCSVFGKDSPIYQYWREGIADGNDEMETPEVIARSWVIDRENCSKESPTVRKKAELLREIVGNPWKRFEWHHSDMLQKVWSENDLLDQRTEGHGVVPLFQWKGGMIQEIAQRIYDKLCFEEISILGDAWEDACYDNYGGVIFPEIAEHCHLMNHEHVRGCWVLDLLLKMEE